MRTAGCLVVGNEILSGKVEEKNIAVLARTLFGLGVSLRRIVVCPDEIPIIARDVNALRKTYDLVFTSGGIGPTHDDVTIDGVAAAFGVGMSREPRMVAALEAYYGARCTEHHLRMANVPDGAEYMGHADPVFTTLKMGNVYVLPGVPFLFQKKLEGLVPVLDVGERFQNRTVFLKGDEGDYAAALEHVARSFQDLEAGSYLAPAGADYDCRVTFDGVDAEQLAIAVEAFLARIDRTTVVRFADSGAA